MPVPQIEFLVCTIDRRIRSVAEMLLPPEEGVAWLVAWQLSEAQTAAEAEAHPLPEALRNRQDVRVVRQPGRGLSRGRNLALSEARGEWLVISDDDCRYTAESLKNLRRAIRLHPDVAALQLRATDLEGNLMHRYAPHSYEYRERPYGAFVSSCELVLHRTAPEPKPLPRFDERFGIGAWLACGEEEVWVHQCSLAGGRIYYEPLPFVATPPGTTGTRFASHIGVQRAKGGVLCIMHGPFGALLRVSKFAWTVPGLGFVQRLCAWIRMIEGVVYVLTHHPLP